MNKSEAIALAKQYEKLPQYPPLILPVPTSKNNLHTRGNKGGWHTKEYKNFRSNTAKIFRLWSRDLGGFSPFQGSKYLHLKFRYQLFRASHAGDPKNHEQALLDALKGFAWEDDAYIHLDNVLPLTPDELVDKDNPRCVIWLNPIQICCTEMKRGAIASAGTWDTMVGSQFNELKVCQP